MKIITTYRGIVIFNLFIVGLTACSSEPAPWTRPDESPWSDQQAAAPASPPPLPQQSGVHMVGGQIQTAHESETEVSPKVKEGSGIGDIIAGVVLIGIGFLFGGSIFLGNPTTLDYLFDGLGLFWIGKGIYRLVR